MALGSATGVRSSTRHSLEEASHRPADTLAALLGTPANPGWTKSLQGVTDILQGIPDTLQGVVHSRREVVGVHPASRTPLITTLSGPTFRPTDMSMVEVLTRLVGACQTSVSCGRGQASGSTEGSYWSL